MGRKRRHDSDLHGVLLVDKPAGPTSHDVVQQVRRAAGQSRIGHTGTLDPAATGVLVLCLGRAAKLVRFLQAGTKTYAARMVLGVTTDSQDADGEVVATADASEVTERSLCEALVRFQGDILQIPPMVSAVKVEGERLHEKARRGEVIDREARAVTVHDLVLDAFESGPRAEASFLVTCSAGTYVRTLAHDVGEALGVGGSLLSLRRIANGPFAEHEAVTPDVLTDEETVRAHLLSGEDAVQRTLPVATIDDTDLARRLTQGGRLPLQGFDGPYALTYGSQLIGIYTDGEREARSELVWTRPEELVLEDPE